MKFCNWLRELMVTEIRKWLEWGTEKGRKAMTMF